jgi:hypothetical protein
MIPFVAQILPTPVPSNGWEFAAIIIFLILQSLVQLFQLRQGNQIKTQTNGLVEAKVKAAEEAAHLAGQQDGILKEQARIRTQLALSNEVNAHLEELKKHD